LKDRLDSSQRPHDEDTHNLLIIPPPNPTHPPPNTKGVPAVYGLYGAFLPVMVYAFFGSSKQLGVGPVAVTSLLIGSGASWAGLGLAVSSCASIH
jgi:hypothetical protein